MVKSFLELANHEKIAKKNFNLGEAPPAPKVANPISHKHMVFHARVTTRIELTASSLVCCFLNHNISLSIVIKKRYILVYSV